MARYTLLRMIALVATGALAAVLSGCAGGSSGTATDPTSQATSSGTDTGHSALSLTVDGQARSYRLYVPTKVAEDGSVPLLIALHGGGGSGAQFEQSSGFDDLADSDGFIVAYPDAERPGSVVSSWNAGGCCGYAARTGIDDVGFIRTLIGSLSARYDIDARRVYVTGISNGGMLAYRAACQIADTVAAIGVQSATLEYAPCHPSEPVSLLHIHGTADTNVPLAGGQGSGRSKADFRPPQEGVATLAAADGCGNSPTEGPDPTLVGAQLHSWRGCPTDIGVQFVTVPGGTHPWMSTSAAQIWSFLAAHPRPKH